MGNAAKVMLIDDDESLHVLMRRIVEDAGYAFCASFDGEEGLTLLADEKPDLLLRDVAACVGYDDSSYFTKVFHQYTGLTPSQFTAK